MKTIDAVFVTPNANKAIFQGLSAELTAIEPPIWAGLLANFTRKKGFSVDIIDAVAENYSVQETVSAIQQRNPRLVVIVVYGQQPSASTQNMHGASLLATALSESGASYKTIMIGGHVSALPQQSLRDEKVDFICEGEGTFTLASLLKANMDSTSDLQNVPGLWYRDGDKQVFSKPAGIVDEANLPTEMPGMAWDLLPMKKYRAHNWHCFGHVNERTPYASVYTSLGCPFKCSFCCINAPFGKPSFRYWDPKFMITEFDLLADKYHVKNIKIADEMFVLKDKHFIELCKLIIDHGHKFNIWVYSRIDTIKPHHLELLKKAGVNWLALGIESGSKHVRDGVTKGRFGDMDIKSIVHQIREAGIYVIGNYIFGLPDDTYASMQDTLDLSLELNCEMANFYSAMAYPGSKLHGIAKENKWSLPQTWSGYSQHSFDALPLPTETLTSDQVLQFRDNAWQAYFTNPGYLAMIKEKFGQETYQHIVDISQIRLNRRYAS